MVFSVDPRFWLAIARDMVRAARRPQPVLKPTRVTAQGYGQTYEVVAVPCPCDCGMTMGEVKELP